MGGPHQGRTDDSQRGPDEVASPGRSDPAAQPEPTEMSERLAAVVQAFRALREPLPDPTPAIASPAGSNLPPPSAAAPAGPLLPRRLGAPGAVLPLGRGGNGASSRRDAPGSEAPSTNGLRVLPAATAPATRDRVIPGTGSPGADRSRMPATDEASAPGYARRDPAGPDLRPALGAATAVDGALLDVAAMAVAVGAFVAPWPWLVIVAAATVGGLTAAALEREWPNPRTLARRAGHRVAAWLRPRSLVWLPVLTARVVLLSVLLPFALGAGRWLVAQGSDGALAAGRAAAWHHGFRVAAAGMCFLLVAGSGAAHDRRILALRRRLQPLGAVRVSCLVAAAVVLIVSVPLVGPRIGGGRLAGADGLAWAPPSLRDEVDGMRDAVVRAELNAVTVCLSEHQDVRWDSTYTSGNPPEKPDVATLRTEQADPAAGDVATAVVALHNQLAPWVEEIEVVAGDASVARIERRGLPNAAPAVGVPVGASAAGDNLLRAGVATFDRGVALRCSAGAVL